MSACDEKKWTANEIREIILEAVSRNGGHLASSLGAVELALALVEVFDPYHDRIVWDVGHQAYAWKILTHREKDFVKTLRRLDGLSGFPNPKESKADAFVAGHAGVAISAAEGFAAARDLRGSDEHVVAIIGDASISNGTSWEALNNCATACSKVIVILNDNEMSISKPTGSFSRYLGRLITSARYNQLKDVIKRMENTLRFRLFHRIIRRVKGFLKRILISGAYFEQMGFRYMGPIDGHNSDALKTALKIAKNETRSVLLHIVTKKGKGFAPAMENPTAWHGVGPFVRADAGRKEVVRANASLSWSDTFGREIVACAEKDSRIVALTAAMKDGTGLTDFAARYPSRFFDVGISEGHLVSFAAGLAAGGMRPVVAIYSTFLQRAIDQVMHDVCLANLPVIFCVDRAGVVGADGATHQGVFDLAMLRALPNLTICQPKDQEDFRELFQEALVRKGPTVIRYPRGSAPEKVEVENSREDFRENCAQQKIAIWATGDYFAKAQAVARRVHGFAIHARYLKPFDAELLAKQRADGFRIVSLENGSRAGGFGEAIRADLALGWPDEFIPHGSIAELEKIYGLDEDSIVAKILGEASAS